MHSDPIIVWSDTYHEFGALEFGQVQKMGWILYDFKANGDDEITMTSGDEVVIIDDTPRQEFWQLRCIWNSGQGICPEVMLSTVRKR